MENFPSLKCFYAILGVEKDSSLAEIRTAYKKLAMRWHPDKCANAKGDAREQAKLKFQVVQEAYAVLSDENKRLLYDAGLHEEIEQDPSMQEFMSELVKKMNGESCVSTKSNADEEYEEMRKLFMNIVDTDSYVRECEQFNTSTGSFEQEHFQETESHIPPANSYNREPPIFSFPCSSVDSSQKVSNVERPPDRRSPPPHSKPFMAMDAPQFDFDSDSFDEISRSFIYKAEEPSPFSPQPHPKLCTEDRQNFDFAALRSALKFGSSASFNFVSSASADCRAPTRAGTSAPSSFDTRGFCMGVGGDCSVKDNRGQGRQVKSRRRRCKDKVVGAPLSSPCDVCGQEKLGAGLVCLCTPSPVNTQSGSPFCVS